MKKTNQKYKSQKQRLNSILLALIWGATIMTGCKMAVSSNGGPTTGTVIPIPISEDVTLASKVEVIKNFITVNENNELLPEEIGKIMVALTKETEGGSFIDRLENLSNIIPEEIPKENPKEIDLEDKRPDDNYSNYTNYEKAYEAAEISRNTYQDYYNKDYIISYNAYKESYDNYSESVKNTPTTAINKLERVLNYLIDDFNDDNIFNLTAKESDKKEKPEYYKVDNLEYYKVDNLETILTEAEAENKPNSELKRSLDANTTTLNWNTKTLNDNYKAAFSQANYVNSFQLNKNNVSITSIDIEDYTSDSGDVNEVKTKVSELTGNISLNIKNTEDEGVYFYDIITLYKALKENENINEDIKIIYPDPSNTTITGALTFELLKDPNISQSDVFKLFFGSDNITETDGKVNVISDIDLNRLPKVNVQFMGDENVNVYGLGIDKLITTYYDIDADIGSDEVNYIRFQSYGSAHYFDAKEALNGKTMYTKNDYNGNAYNLDINAALLIGGGGIKNVNIIGTNKTNKTEMSSVTNVRVSSDVSDIRFGAGSGVIDFEIAPAKTPVNLIASSTQAKVIIRNIKEGSSVIFGTTHTIDVSELTSFNGILNPTGITAKEVYLNSSQNPNAFASNNAGAREAVYVDGVPTLVNEGYTPLNATNADWERAGNTDGGIPTIPQNTANVSQANVKSIKSLVMKRLLDDNQRIYG